MPAKTRVHCIDAKDGKLLGEAQSFELSENDRKRDHRVFFGEHLDRCEACRQSMFYHAMLTALGHVAADKGISVDDVVGDLAQVARRLKKTARKRGISFSDAVKETLTRERSTRGMI